MGRDEFLFEIGRRGEGVDGTEGVNVDGDAGVFRSLEDVQTSDIARSQTRNEGASDGFVVQW